MSFFFVRQSFEQRCWTVFFRSVPRAHPLTALWNTSNENSSENELVLKTSGKKLRRFGLIRHTTFQSRWKFQLAILRKKLSGVMSHLVDAADCVLCVIDIQ